MCIMLTKPAGVKLNYTALEECHYLNHDGCGYAAALPGGKLVAFRDHNITFKSFWARLKRYEGCAMLIHFRHATSGGVNIDNTHPFLIGKGDYAMAHNGIIKCDELPGESDSRAFIRLAIDPYLGQYPDCIEHKKWLEYAKNAIGYSSKLAFIRKDGKFFYVNRNQGTDAHGCWWSNTMFRRTVVRGGQGIGFQQGLLQDYEDEYELADRIYQRQQDRRREEAMDALGDQHMEHLFNQRVEAAETFLRDSNIVKVEDMACSICNDFIEPPYLLDIDTGDAMCMSCKNAYAKEWDINEPLDEETDDAGTATTESAATTTINTGINDGGATENHSGTCCDSGCDSAVCPCSGTVGP